MKAVIPGPVLEAGSGGWGFLYYIWFLLAGFITVASEPFQRMIRDQRWFSLHLGAILTATHLYGLFGPYQVAFPGWVLYVLSVTSAWCWLFAILGFGMRHLNVNRPFLREANEGVLPFFILHQPALVLVGFFVTGWDLDAVYKWAITFFASFSLVIAIYAGIVRRVDFFRFLFGMKTQQPSYAAFRRKKTLIPVHVLYFGLIALAVFYQAAGKGGDRSPAPLVYNAEADVILGPASVTDRSPDGVRVVHDEAASQGSAIEFTAGASQRIEPHPGVYLELQFTSPAGRYFVWLRGKTDLDNGYTDSVWLQVDGQIGTGSKGVRLGNWLDVNPAGIYGWAGDTDAPVFIELAHDGEHTVRIQPRQVPHRIDQIWLSRTQNRIPDTKKPIP
jgi:hypothetical protein